MRNLLSICMAGMSHRPKPYLKNIMEIAPEWVEFVFDDRDDISIGTKRNEMIQRCTGEYIAMIDDDDSISAFYFSQILKGIELGVDVIALTTSRYEDGEFKYNHNFGFKNPFSENVAQCSPAGHFCPVNADIVKRVLYKDLGRGEDFDHCGRLIEYLKTAYYPPYPLYYQYFETREKEYDRHDSAGAFQIKQLPKV